ncbi:MAG: hypothetical protein H6867_07250 [Rhodospirillales bacterium]|nr:hypothetical protein [Rhodospirillales bacterium]MCB9995347.1 hypothetical protein [Rhodospirillales bacterium]
MYTDKFNDAAKVVSYAEYLARQQQLLDQELTRREKLLVNLVERHVSARSWSAFIHKSLSEQSEIEGFYRDPEDGEGYVSGAFLDAVSKWDMEKSWTPDLTRKAHEIGVKAFAACKDHRDKVPGLVQLGVK